MTVGEWLDGRTPRPPEALARRVRAALGRALDAPAAETPERCLDAADRLLDELLRDAAGRDAALDLLAADALVTYAFEAAAEEPPLLERRAVAAMVRIAESGREAP